MAGGKETPRQKMIGMMYLVLTALLALQVSNAVLDKFMVINATLEQVVKESDIQNSITLGAIEQEVVKSGNRPDHVNLLANAKKVRELTAGIEEEMNALKQKFIDITGGPDPDNPKKIVGAKDYDKVANMMISTEEGPKFEKHLDDYVVELNKIIKASGLEMEEFHQLTRDAKEIDLFKDDPDHANKDFLTLTFESTPTAAGMASVSQMEAEILEYETAILEAMAAKINAVPVKFNIIVPMVKPKSEIVALGDTYEADLFVVASAEGIDPVMEVNGKKLEVKPDEHKIMTGKVSIPATSAGDKTIVTKITMNDSTYEATYHYNVMVPTITVISGGARTLYENCANPLDVQVPMLGASYEPQFSASNARTRGGAKGKVEVIPTSRRRVTLSVSSQGNKVGSVDFDVKRVPQPMIQILDASGKRADNVPNISPGQARSLTVRVLADENFTKECPNDSRYVVSSVRVLVAGSGWKPFNGARATLEGRIAGTVAIEIAGVSRIKYDGSRENVQLDSKFKSVVVQ